jgi:hypothetical protein
MKVQVTATEDSEFHIYPIYNRNCRDISTIYVYNKTSIKRNILTIKKIQRELDRAKDLSAPRYRRYCKDTAIVKDCTFCECHFT